VRLNLADDRHEKFNGVNRIPVPMVSIAWKALRHS
jgi:hypothetical protein